MKNNTCSGSTERGGGGRINQYTHKRRTKELLPQSYFRFRRKGERTPTKWCRLCTSWTRWIWIRCESWYRTNGQKGSSFPFSCGSFLFLFTCNTFEECSKEGKFFLWTYLKFSGIFLVLTAYTVQVVMRNILYTRLTRKLESFTRHFKMTCDLREGSGKNCRVPGGSNTNHIPVPITWYEPRERERWSIYYTTARRGQYQCQSLCVHVCVWVCVCECGSV